MIDESWFETVGRQHFRKFFSQLENALEEGKEKGLKPQKINVDDFFRIYRRDHLSIPFDQINALREKGYRISEISELTGVPAKFIYHHFWRLKHEANRTRSKSG